MIKVYYTDAEVSGLDESTLRLSWYNNDTGAWVSMSAGTPAWCNGAGVDTTNNYVWANVTHLSLYGVSGSAPSATTTTQASSGGGGGGGGGIGATTISTIEIVKNIGIYKIMSFSYLQDNGETSMHSIKVMEVTDTTATLQIMSTLKTYTVNVGDTIYVDLDDDGTSDMNVRLISTSAGILAKSAQLGVSLIEKVPTTPGPSGELITPVIPEPTVPQEQMMIVEPTMPESTTTTTRAKPVVPTQIRQPSMWEKILTSPPFWISIIIILIIIAAVLLYKMYHRKKHKRNWDEHFHRNYGHHLKEEKK
jgi:hypothetical protein